MFNYEHEFKMFKQERDEARIYLQNGIFYGILKYFILFSKDWISGFSLMKFVISTT